MWKQCLTLAGLCTDFEQNLSDLINTWYIWYTFHQVLPHGHEVALSLASWDIISVSLWQIREPWASHPRLPINEPSSFCFAPHGHKVANKWQMLTCFFDCTLWHSTPILLCLEFLIALSCRLWVAFWNICSAWMGSGATHCGSTRLDTWNYMKLHALKLHCIALDLPYWSCCHVFQIVANSPDETHTFAGPGHIVPCRACALWVPSVSSIILIRAEILSSSVSMMTPLSVTCQNGTVTDSSCQVESQEAKTASVSSPMSVPGHSIGNTGASNLI